MRYDILSEMANSSTHIMDLPENISMAPFSGEQRFSGSLNDRGIDMESTTYRQMNPHQNPYMQGQQRMDTMPLPEYAGAGRGGPPPPPPLPPIYDFEQGSLGNAPKFSLPPKDIPLDTSGFQDESAKPNYIPQHRLAEDYVLNQEERIRETKSSKEIRNSINSKFDLIAELQMPIIVSLLFLVFQSETINRLMARYLKFAGFFGEDGYLNTMGMLFKSTVFGCIYYGAVNVAKLAE